MRVFSGPALSNLALLLYVNSQLVLAAHAGLEVLAPGSAACRALVDGVYWAMDWALGGGLLCVVSLCAWLGVVDWLQTRLLFSATFADSVRRGKMVRGRVGRVMLEVTSCPGMWLVFLGYVRLPCARIAYPAKPLCLRPHPTQSPPCPSGPHHRPHEAG